MVAALAIPFLAFDQPATAEAASSEVIAAGGQADAASETEFVASGDSSGPVEGAIEIVVVDQIVSPDIAKLAELALQWTRARNEAIEAGLVDVRLPSSSDTNLGLLPEVVNEGESEPAIAEADSAGEPEPEPEQEQPVQPEPQEPQEPQAPPAVDEPDEPVTEPDEPVEEPVDPSPQDPDEQPPVEPEPEEPGIPVTPQQVDGRVPPPAGGPTGAQWDALRMCESTHNYSVVNSTGTYRGAYQFSQQTWDWVAGIHWPHLVGVDPAAAEPAWQDIMAYTLYAMRGWDQWPVCGQHLL